jgi:hypothetical protein
MNFVMLSQHFRLQIKWLKLCDREPEMNDHCVRSVLLLYSVLYPTVCDSILFASTGTYIVSLTALIFS